MLIQMAKAVMPRYISPTICSGNCIDHTSSAGILWICVLIGFQIKTKLTWNTQYVSNIRKEDKVKIKRKEEGRGHSSMVNHGTVFYYGVL